MYDHWLTLGGVELVNSTRAAQYAGALGITVVRCAGCRDITRALRDAPYTLPGDPDNPAPWYDPSLPESAGFAGLVGVEFEGLSRGTGGRQTVPLLGAGSAIGGLRRGAREVLVKALMLATTDAAMSYGTAWLASALRGSICQTSCVADELCVFAYCPSCASPPPDPPAYDSCGDAALRTVLDTGLLAGPTPTRTLTVGGGVLTEVEFSLVCGQPFLWRQPRYVTGTGQPGVSPAPPIGPGEGCVESIDCAHDPLCLPLPPPIRPPAPPNPCFPGPPPVGDTRRTIVTVPPGLLPQWFENVPILEIRTGSLALRRVTIRFYSNPALYECAEYVDPCTACAEINIPYLPRGVVFRLDGRLERATVDCPGGPGLDVADVEVFGPGGGLFEWPIFECNTSLCIEVVVQQSTAAPDSRIDLWMAAREDAA